MMAPVNFCRAVAKSGATVVYTVPSLILREAKGQELAFEALRDSRLRHVVFAGEPIDKPALARLRPLIPGVALHNWFGPTETNVCAFHAISDTTSPRMAWCRSAAPALCQLRDRGMRRWRRPRTGELLVAGDTVLTAYWNRPDDTAARIVEIDGVRHYRSGDYVFDNARGELVFVGRRDRQVKIGGRRVQIDEIEAAFRKHLPALEVACTLIRREGAEPAIAAAVVGEPVPDGDALRAALADALPLWMMPERLVALPALPAPSAARSTTTPRGAPFVRAMDGTGGDFAHDSPALGRRKLVQVRGPEAVDAGTPILILLHPFAGNRTSWARHAPAMIADLARDTLVAMPECGRRWFIDDHAGVPYGRSVAKDLVPALAVGAGGPWRSALWRAAAPPRPSATRHIPGGARGSRAFTAAGRVGDPYAAARTDDMMIRPRRSMTV
jgi:hypothetical protein